MGKKLKSIIIILGILLVLVGGIFIYYFTCMDPHRGTISAFGTSKSLDEVFTREKALNDLQFVYRCVTERHPAWLDGNQSVVTAFEQQYELEKEFLTSKEKYTTLEVWQACARLTSIMGDGHTGVYYITENPKFIEDVTQMNQYGLPIRIDGITLEEIEKTFLSLYFYEREEFALREFYSSFINIDYWLAACGVDISDGVIFTFDTPEGEKDFTYQFVTFDQMKGLPNYEDENTIEENKWVFYTIDPEKDTAVFTLNTCTYNEEYRITVDAFWKEVLDTGIHNVIVDLRGNGGGSSTVGDYFLSYLNVETIRGWDYATRLGWFLYKEDDYVIKCHNRDRSFEGDLYVLTDIYTYSSAMDFAMLVSDNQLGTLIGEASGNMPDGYGELLRFQTPNAKLGVCVSCKRWWRVDQSKSGQPIVPDIEVDGYDALEKAYEVIMK